MPPKIPPALMNSLKRKAAQGLNAAKTHVVDKGKDLGAKAVDKSKELGGKAITKTKDLGVTAKDKLKTKYADYKASRTPIAGPRPPSSAYSGPGVAAAAATGAVAGATMAGVASGAGRRRTPPPSRTPFGYTPRSESKGKGESKKKGGGGSNFPFFGGHKEQGGGLAIGIVIFLLSIHLFDTFVLGISRFPSSMLLIIILYIIAIALICRVQGLSFAPWRDSYYYWVGLLCVLFLPLVVSLLRPFSNLIPDFFFGLWPFFPIMLGIFLFSESSFDTGIFHWGRLYYEVIFWVIFFILLLGHIVIPTQLQSAPVAVLDHVKALWDIVWDSIVRMYEKLMFGYEQSIAYATGKYYQGTVENQGEPLGIYVEEFEPTEEEIIEGTPLYALAIITGKTLEDPIHLKASCATDDGIVGTTSPTELEIEYEVADTIECQIPSLPKGRHQLILTLTFNFETWGYSPLTFVDKGAWRAMMAEKKDILQELQITDDPTMTYSPGPVSIGMMKMNHPIPVEENSNLSFGVTIGNDWTNGEVERVDKNIIMVPKEFELSDCSPAKETFFGHKDPETDEEDPAYNFYLLENPHVGRTFKTSHCRLILKDKDALLGLEQKAIRSFIVRTSYQYTMKERSSARVIG